MSTNAWKAGEDVVQTMKDVVAKYHPDLVGVVDEIAVLFREKGTNVDGHVIAGKTSKAPAILGVLFKETPYTFIITLAADVWEELNDKQRVALLDHHLCACGAEEDDETGEMRYFLRVPDVAFFKEEVARHGAWRSSGAPPSQNLVEELFGTSK